MFIELFESNNLCIILSFQAIQKWKQISNLKTVIFINFEFLPNLLPVTAQNRLLNNKRTQIKQYNKANKTICF